MIRCCMCHHRDPLASNAPGGLEKTNLPGSGYRCTDHEACAGRVREIVSAHVGFGEIAKGTA